VRIAFVGAGGVGSYYGGLLARAGHDVTLLARGAHLGALRARALEVRTPEETFTARVAATDNPQAVDPVELAVVAVKNFSLGEVAPIVRTFAASGAVILPLLNGVDVVERLEALGVGRDSILSGLTAISAVRVGPGCVERRSSYQRVVVGEPAGGGSPRAESVARAFREAGTEAEVAADITLEIWRKFAFIASVAAACGLARSPLGPLRETPLGRLLLERAVGEVIAVARVRGVAFGQAAEDSVHQFIAAQPASLKPSLLLDLEAGRPTEIAHMSGAVSRLARQAGLATPIHDTAAAALGDAGPLH
jgi:2-dehydropantoate 2-reductase